MIFDNLELIDLSPKLDIFLWQTAGCTLPMNFALSTSRNDIKGSSMPYKLFAM